MQMLILESDPFSRAEFEQSQRSFCREIFLLVAWSRQLESLAEHLCSRDLLNFPLIVQQKGKPKSDF